MPPETDDNVFPKPLYFPVADGPYRLRAALHNWPEPGERPWGNHQDGFFFQYDDDLPETQAAKLATGHKPQIILDDSTRELHKEVLCWISRTLADEVHPSLLPCGRPEESEPPKLKNELEWYEYYGNVLGEDIVVLQRAAPGRDRVVMEDVRFPSGWNPSLILGQSFQTVHQEVPDFSSCDKRAKAFVDTIVERGPYTRFVWMLATMPDLNVHEEIDRPEWKDVNTCYFRVERQCTIPFPDQSGSVFLIRPYTYPVESLTQEQRDTLISVLKQTPTKEATYKGWTLYGEEQIRILRNCTAISLSM